MTARNPAKYFVRNDVQNILIKLAGFDLSKIFQPRFNINQQKSNISLLTHEQLDRVRHLIILNSESDRKLICFFIKGKSKGRIQGVQADANAAVSECANQDRGHSV